MNEANIAKQRFPYSLLIIRLARRTRPVFKQNVWQTTKRCCPLLHTLPFVAIRALGIGLLSIRILATCKLEREEKCPPQFHTCSFSPICFLSPLSFCVRSEYAIPKKLFLRKRLLRSLFTWDCFLKGKRKRKKKKIKNTCEGTVWWSHFVSGNQLVSYTRQMDLVPIEDQSKFENASLRTKHFRI